MIVTIHQPMLLLWPGLFFKAMKADCMILLDDVRFPQGRGLVKGFREKKGLTTF